VAPAWQQHLSLPTRDPGHLHGSNTTPSPHAIRVTCMQLLPLVEMYCRWQLQNDTSNLEALMRRFDSEAELQSHELGRALLHMVRDDAEGLLVSRPGVPHGEPHVEVGDPFHAVREQLAAVGNAFRNLHPQVLIVVVCCSKIRSGGNIQATLRCFFSFLFRHTCNWTPLAVRQYGCGSSIQIYCRWILCPLPAFLLRTFAHLPACGCVMYFSRL
jgi:hypothetical protein